ncbi:MAG: hypothetical protein ACRCST_09650 [Turicibacter sp.]
METLNIDGMMKNKHLSKPSAQQRLYEFKLQVKCKCDKYSISFVEVDKRLPFSKM